MVCETVSSLLHKLDMVTWYGQTKENTSDQSNKIKESGSRL